MTSQPPEEAPRSWIFAFRWTLISSAALVLLAVGYLTHANWLQFAAAGFYLLMLVLNFPNMRTMRRQANTRSIPPVQT